MKRFDTQGARRLSPVVSPAWSRAFDRRGFLGLCALAALGSAGCTPDAEGSGSGGGGSTVVFADEVEDEPLTQAQMDAAAAEAFEPTPLSLDEVPSGFSVFSLSDVSEPTIDDALLDAVQSAVDDIEERSEVGFVFYDLYTGRGLAYGADTAIYGASSFKALYSLFICECVAEEQGYELSSTTRSRIEAAVVYSDNDSYRALRASFDGYGFDEWLAERNVSDVSSDDPSSFPTYCARTSARLWTEMYLYLQTGSELAEWLEGLVGSTSTSFLRDALEETDAEVLNKAGWIAGSQEKYNSTTDAGIVTLDGDSYILSIMTSAAYTDAAVERYEQLAQAVFAMREALGVEEG